MYATCHQCVICCRYHCHTAVGFKLLSSQLNQVIKTSPQAPLLLMSSRVCSCLQNTFPHSLQLQPSTKTFNLGWLSLSWCRHLSTCQFQPWLVISSEYSYITSLCIHCYVYHTSCHTYQRIHQFRICFTRRLCTYSMPKRDCVCMPNLMVSATL